MPAFANPSPAANLELEIGNDGVVIASDDKTIDISAGGTPNILSANDQVFVVGGAATPMATITVSDSSGGAITKKRDIRIRIPTSFNMTWDTSLTNVTLGGPAASLVSTTVSYEDANRTLILSVETDFSGGDWITISGLRFDNFSAVSPSDNLELDIDDDATADDTDERFIVIPQATISSASNQSFTVGDASTLAERITIQDDATFPIIVAANDLRIRIPAGFTMTWDTTVTAVTLSGTASGKVSSTVTYEDSGRTAVLDVTTDFAALDELRVDDLRFTDFAAPSASDNLELEVGNDGIVSSIDNTTVDISPGGTANILSAFDQVFTYSGAPTGAAKITISDSSSGDIKKKKEIRIRIPLSFAMTWDTSISTLTLGGNAVGKVDSTVKAYEDGGKTLVLDVTTDFSAGDYVTISGAQFANFAANSGPDTLELEVRNDGSVTDTDDKTITIVGGPAAAISSASSQSFTVGAAPTVAATITITDSVDSGTITKADDVRIRIPAGFNMVWDTSVTTISLGGPAAGKVKSNLKAYEDAGKTAVIDISNNFAASDQFTIECPSGSRAWQVGCEAAGLQWWPVRAAPSERAVGREDQRRRCGGQASATVEVVVARGPAGHGHQRGAPAYQ